MTESKVELYSFSKARKKGAIDGRDWAWKFWPFSKDYASGHQSDPPLDAEAPSRYEYELISHARNNLEILSAQWAQADMKYKESCKNALVKHHDAREALDKESPEASTAFHDLETARKKYSELPLPHLIGYKKWLLLIVICISEVFFNKLVFSVFGQSNFETWMMTIGLMVVILAIPHFIGAKLRTRNKSKEDYIGIIIGCTAVIASMFVIAVLRVKFFEANNVVEILKIKWDSDSIGIAFFIVNIVIAVGVIMIGYESAHEDKTEHDNRRQDLEKAEQNYKEQAAEATQAQKAMQAASMELNKAHVVRTKRFQEIQHQAYAEVKGWKSLIEVYRTANMEARRDKRQPISFLKDVGESVSMPSSLVELDYCDKCPAKE